MINRFRLSHVFTITKSSVGGSVSLFLLCLLTSGSALGQNPLVAELSTTGFETADGKQIVLPKPLLEDGMTAAEQEAALLPIAKPRGRDRFYKGDIRSVFAFDVEQVEEYPDGAKLREVKVFFVANGTIEDVNENNLLDGVGKPSQGSDNAIPQDSRELTEQELVKAGLQIGKQENGSYLSYGTIQVNLIDKVYLDVVTKSQTTKEDQSLSMGTSLDESLAKLTELPSTWQPIDRVKNQLQLGMPKEDFFAAAGYVKATALKNEAGKILVEIHVMFVEPEAWYNGRNLLGSKLAPVIDDSVTKFRRKLAQAQKKSNKG